MQEHQQGGFPMSTVPSVTLNNGVEMPILGFGVFQMSDPAECTAFNAGRYRWVKKRIERTETVSGGTEAETVVYSIGTLHGEWPDGTPFEGNRYVDRYVVSMGLIVGMEVWNDSAEWLLVRAGLATLEPPRS